MSRDKISFINPISDGHESLVSSFFPEFLDSPYIAFYSGPVATPSGTFIKIPEAFFSTVIINKHTNDTNVLFDNIFEADVDLYVKKIYKILDQIPNINRSKVFYFTAAIDAQKYHDDFCDRNNIDKEKRIRLCVINFWEYFLLSRSHGINYTPNSNNRKKTFLCFNRMLRIHRLALASLIANENLLEYGYYSLFKSTYGDDMFEFYKNKILKDSNEFLQQKFKNGVDIVEQKLPLVLNITQDNNMIEIQESDISLFDDSHFSLVTETNCIPTKIGNDETQGNIFFTEKIFKPIMMRHPFILIGTHNILKNLRNLGYKTFSPFIDESYDDEPDYLIRIEKIVDEVKRLNSFSKEQWIEWHSSIEPIINHNYEKFMSKKFPEDYIIGKY